MKLTPMDINKKEFKRALRGYCADEVDEFLEQIVENFEELYKENASLNEKITSLNEKIEYYSNLETTIQKTLILAEGAAQEAKNSAIKEADIIVKNANEAAQKLLDNSHEKVISINNEYERVKQEFTKFREKYRNFMNTQLDTFDDLERDFVDNYNVSGQIEEELCQKEASIATDEDDKEESLNDNPADNLNEIKSFFVNE